MGVSENVVYPIVPTGFADHYPVFKWLFHWEYTQHFQTNPNAEMAIKNVEVLKKSVQKVMKFCINLL